MNADGSGQMRLTNNTADDEDPNWSPDASRFAFISMRDGHYEIYVMNADGSSQTRVTNTTENAIDPDWRPQPAVPVAPSSWGRTKSQFR
jgi:Tol biopolymer transport system component